jgi:hypothetical protein
MQLLNFEVREKNSLKLMYFSMSVAHVIITNHTTNNVGGLASGQILTSSVKLERSMYSYYFLCNTIPVSRTGTS